MFRSDTKLSIDEQDFRSAVKLFGVSGTAWDLKCDAIVLLVARAITKKVWLPQILNLKLAEKRLTSC